jgi:GntR family transcriptional repressor for pyruvate dehydrogenase complex
MVADKRQLAHAAGTPAPAVRPGITVGHVNRDDRRRTMKTSERVSLHIVRDIVAQGLRTGDRLPLEAAMTQQYGVSRASLREALRLLEVQGLIHLKPGPGGGPVVGSVQPSHLARTASLYFHLGSATYGQLMQTQVLLEPLCAQLAAQHLDRVEVMAPFLADLEVGEERRYRTKTIDFHRAVWELAANPVLTLLTEAVTHLVTHHVVSTMDPVELRQDIIDEHAVLARTISAGQADKAARLMAEHFQAQHDYYAEHWPARLSELIEWR